VRFATILVGNISKDKIMSGILVKVVEKTREAKDIFSYELVGESGVVLPPFSAGAHIDVKVGDKLTRQYSLCNSPSEPHRYVIGVLKDAQSRGGSVTMHEDVDVGDTLEISAPKNHFPLEVAPHTLLFAGGIGITPILCMAERLAEIGADFHMHYCTRGPDRTAFYERIRNARFADRVAFHFDDGAPEQKLDLLRILREAPSDTHVYVCGPGGYIDYVKDAARSMGWSGDRVHFEYFGASPAALVEGGQFEVKLASSGASYVVAAHRTVLQVLQDEGIEVPVSCEQGVCGTCITRVLEGTPDHRDLYFTDDEKAANDRFTPCCSRSKTPVLVLDL
jgi:vanillate O-demethylase ferredoxin subunit